MLNLITGRAGCGKTTYAFKLLDSLIKSGGSEPLLIVPEQFSFETERAVLSFFGNVDAQRIKVLSFTRLADFLNKSIGGLSGPFADDGTKIILMMHCLEGLQDRLSFYSNPSGNIALAEKLLSLCTELRREAVSPQLLKDIAFKKTEAENLKKKLGDISLIYESYASLFDKSCADRDSLFDLLAEKASESRFFEGCTAVLDSFKGFTAQEFEILRILMMQGDNLYVTLCTPDIYGEEPSMIFNSVNETGKSLISLAKKENIKIKITPLPCSSQRFNSEALKFSEEKLYCPTCESFGRRTDDIQIWEAYDAKDECMFIAAEIKRLIREEGFRLRDIAVIVRDEKRLGKQLISAFEKYEIPFFEDKRQPIANQPLITFCRCLLGILVSGFTEENIFGCLKSSLSPLSELETAELENYFYTWELKASDWTRPFDKNPFGLDEVPEEKVKEKLEQLNLLREKAVAPILSLKALLDRQKEKDGLSAAFISEKLYAFLLETHTDKKLKELALRFSDDSYVELAYEQNRIWEILTEILDSLSSVRGEEKLSLSLYQKLFCAVVSATELAHIPSAADEISFGSADRMRLGAKRAVFVADCEEGIFPKAVQEEGLLSMKDRAFIEKKLRELGLRYTVLSSDAELKACEERFTVYSAITSATDRLYVTYHSCEADKSGGDSGKDREMQPSSFVLSLKELFDCAEEDEVGMPKDSESEKPEKEGPCAVSKAGEGIIRKTKDIDCEFFAQSPASLFYAYSLSSKPAEKAAFREAAGELTGKSEPVREADSASSSDAERLNRLFKAVELAECEEEFEIKDKKIAYNLFGGDVYLSSSRTQNFFECPFKYFCNYGLRLSTRKKAEFSAMQKGNMFHYAFEMLLRDNKREELIKADRSTIRHKSEALFDSYVKEKLGGLENKNESFRYDCLANKPLLCHSIDSLCEDLKSSALSPCDFELEIGRDKALEAYTLELPDGGTLSLSGKADRVDKYEKNGKSFIAITDYKTGPIPDFKAVSRGLNMQTIIYLFAVQNNGAERYGKPVPAAALYYKPPSSLFTAEEKQGAYGNKTLSGKKILFLLPKEESDFPDFAELFGSKEKGEGAEGKDAEGKGTDSKGAKGKGAEVKGAEGKDAESKCAKGKGAESKGNKDKDVIIIDDKALLEELKKHIDGKLIEMARQLHDGLTAARPSEEACRYCDYADICRKSPELIDKQKDEELIDFLRGLRKLSENAKDGAENNE